MFLSGKESYGHGDGLDNTDGWINLYLLVKPVEDEFMEYDSEKGS
jgi:hypothetical protein